MARGKPRTGGLTTAKRRRLEAAGWVVGSAADFLGLSLAEQAMVEIRLNLGTLLQNRRRALGLSQAALAQRLGSSQSRVAKMEAADRTVTLDLLVRALISVGVTRRAVARALAA